LVLLRSVYGCVIYREIVGVFVRFRAPLQLPVCGSALSTSILMSSPTSPTPPATHHTRTPARGPRPPRPYTAAIRFDSAPASSALVRSCTVAMTVYTHAHGHPAQTARGHPGRRKSTRLRARAPAPAHPWCVCITTHPVRFTPPFFAPVFAPVVRRLFAPVVSWIPWIKPAAPGA
jgi:hypothetical protein